MKFAFSLEQKYVKGQGKNFVFQCYYVIDFNECHRISKELNYEEFFRSAIDLIDKNVIDIKLSNDG